MNICQLTFIVGLHPPRRAAAHAFLAASEFFEAGVDRFSPHSLPFGSVILDQTMPFSLQGTLPDLGPEKSSMGLH